MKLTKHLIAIGCASAALLMAGVTSAQEKPAAKNDQKPGPNRPPAAAPDRSAAIARFLNLSDEQKTKIKPILDEENAQMRALRDDKNLTGEARTAKFREIREAATAKVKPILSDEQFEKWLRTHPRPGARPNPTGPGGAPVPGQGAGPKPAPAAPPSPPPAAAK